MRFAGVVASISVACAACFDPHPPPGSPCSVDGRCPNGQMCVADTCVLEGGADAPSGTADAAIDAAPGTPDAAGCVSWDVPNLGDACALVGPGALSISGPGWSLNADTGEVKHGSTSLFPPSAVVAQVGSTETVRVVALTAFTIDTNTELTIDGSLPVILVVHGDATISGSIAASAEGGSNGPGAPSSLCTPATPGTAGTVSGGGGGGGGFGKEGGDGTIGAGDGLGGTGGTHGNRGQQSGDLQLSPLLAGCRGAQGAGPGTMTGGGGAGGAFEISARDALSITGTIEANGGGGAGGTIHTGGGGGGSGGGLLLDGNIVTVTASGVIVANGGGGGGGGGATTSGGPGAGGRNDATSATGGSAGDGGGVGGVGGRRNADSGGDAGLPANDLAGGGGAGGGGVGRIRIRGRSSRNLDANAVISPSPN